MAIVTLRYISSISVVVEIQVIELFNEINNDLCSDFLRLYSKRLNIDALLVYFTIMDFDYCCSKLL